MAEYNMIAAKKTQDQRGNCVAKVELTSSAKESAVRNNYSLEAPQPALSADANCTKSDVSSSLITVPPSTVSKENRTSKQT